MRTVFIENLVWPLFDDLDLGEHCHAAISAYPHKDDATEMTELIEKQAYDEAVKFINWLEKRFEPDRKYSTGAREILTKIDEWKSLVGGS